MHAPARGLRPILAVVVAGMLSACSTTPAVQRAAPVRGFGNDRDGDLDAPVAVVGGRAVTKAHLADYWFDRYPEEYGRTLDALIDEHVVAREVHTQGLRLPAGELDRAIAAEVGARRKQLEAVYGSDADLAAEVRRAYGTDIAGWKRTVLLPRLRARLLMQRVIRLDTRSRPRIHVRVIVLDSAERAERVLSKLRTGADFSLVALKESADPSAKVGGTLPPIARGDLAVAAVEEQLFAAPIGRLVGPLEVAIDGRRQWHIYKVIRRAEPWQLTGQALRDRLEQDVRERPVSRPEYERWRARIRRDRDVRYFRPDGRAWEPPQAR